MSQLLYLSNLKTHDQWRLKTCGNKNEGRTYRFPQLLSWEVYLSPQNILITYINLFRCLKAAFHVLQWCRGSLYFSSFPDKYSQKSAEVHSTKKMYFSFKMPCCLLECCGNCCHWGVTLITQSAWRMFRLFKQAPVWTLDCDSDYCLRFLSVEKPVSLPHPSIHARTRNHLLITYQYSFIKSQMQIRKTGFYIPWLMVTFILCLISSAVHQRWCNHIHAGVLEIFLGLMMIALHWVPRGY